MQMMMRSSLRAGARPQVRAQIASKTCLQSDRPPMVWPGALPAPRPAGRDLRPAWESRSALDLRSGWQDHRLHCYFAIASSSGSPGWGTGPSLVVRQGPCLIPWALLARPPRCRRPAPLRCALAPTGRPGTPGPLPPATWTASWVSRRQGSWGALRGVGGWVGRRWAWGLCSPARIPASRGARMQRLTLTAARSTAATRSR